MDEILVVPERIPELVIKMPPHYLQPYLQLGTCLAADSLELTAADNHAVTKPFLQRRALRCPCRYHPAIFLWKNLANLHSRDLHGYHLTARRFTGQCRRLKSQGRFDFSKLLRSVIEHCCFFAEDIQPMQISAHENRYDRGTSSRTRSTLV